MRKIYSTPSIKIINLNPNDLIATSLTLYSGYSDTNNLNLSRRGLDDSDWEDDY